MDRFLLHLAGAFAPALVAFIVAGVLAKLLLKYNVSWKSGLISFVAVWLVTALAAMYMSIGQSILVGAPFGFLIIAGIRDVGRVARPTSAAPPVQSPEVIGTQVAAVAPAEPAASPAVDAPSAPAPPIGKYVLGGLFAIAAGAVFFAVVANSAKPTTFEDCILKNVKQGSNDSATRALTRACRTKFPLPEPIVRDLTAVELGALEGRGGLEYGLFTGQVYNGNRHIQVLSVEVVILFDDDKSEERHRETVNISPLSLGEISFATLDKGPMKYTYYFAAATGSEPLTQ